MKDWGKRHDNPTGRQLHLARTFTASWEQLGDEHARQIFFMCGYCAPNQVIPRTLLEQAAELDEHECGQALATLTGLGLLEMEPGEAGPKIHPLLAEYARAAAAEAGTDTALASLTSALLKVAAAANRQIDETGDLEHMDPWLPHLRSVAAAAESRKLEDAGALLNALGYYLREAADYQGARAAYERALAIDEAVYGPDHPNVASRVNNLGGVLQDLGDLPGRGRPSSGRWPSTRRSLAPTIPTSPADVNNLGGVLQDLGDLPGRGRPTSGRWRSTRRSSAPTIPTSPPASTTWAGCCRTWGTCRGAGGLRAGAGHLGAISPTGASVDRHRTQLSGKPG